MKANIFTKLFLILLFNLLLILAVTLASVHWSFKRGFSDYLLKAEASQLDSLVKVLEKKYALEGNWQFLQQDHRRWFDLLRQGLGDDHLPPNMHPHDHDFPPPHEHDHPPFDGPPHELDHPPFDGPPHEHDPEHEPPHHHPPEMETVVLAKFLGSRVRLLDTNKIQIAGIPLPGKSEYLRPISYNNNTVGWLTLQASDLISDHLANAFVSEQIRANFINASLALGLAIISSIFLARKLLVPIKRLTNAAHDLVDGKYTTQIAVTSNDELGNLAKDFNLLARTLHQNEQLRRQWIADISHELRTPIAILRGEIEAIQDGIREPSKKTIQSLHTEVMNLTQLVNDLYDLSISDLGMLSNNKQLIEFTNFLDEVVDSYQQRFTETGLQLRYLCHPDQNLIIDADPRRLRQLILNILENSRRYTTLGGFCEVSCQLHGQSVRLTFQDTPPAVPEIAISKLFERLYRVEQSRNRELGGAGLGLAISQAIVHAHGGSIRAFHSEFGGLGIEVLLPMADSNHH